MADDREIGRITDKLVSKGRDCGNMLVAKLEKPLTKANISESIIAMPKPALFR